MLITAWINSGCRNTFCIIKSMCRALLSVSDFATLAIDSRSILSVSLESLLTKATLGKKVLLVTIEKALCVLLQQQHKQKFTHLFAVCLQLDAIPDSSNHTTYRNHNTSGPEYSCRRFPLFYRTVIFFFVQLSYGNSHFTRSCFVYA